METYRIDIYQQMRSKIREWLEDRKVNYRFADYLLCAPDLLHLLCRLSLDHEVPVREKAKLAAVIAYFVSPVDLLSELVIGPIGYADDVVMTAYALNGLINQTDPEIVKKHWAGDGDVLNLIKEILELASEMIGGKLWKRVRDFVDSH
jgi:uncharacterized membrane protein YkvA (DUF1232 family)